MYLKGLKINQFKKLYGLSLKELCDVNYLIGKTGSGKTRTLQSIFYKYCCDELLIENINESQMEPLRDALFVRDDTVQIDIEGGQIKPFYLYRYKQVLEETNSKLFKTLSIDPLQIGMGCFDSDLFGDISESGAMKEGNKMFYKNYLKVFHCLQLEMPNLVEQLLLDEKLSRTKSTEDSGAQAELRIFLLLIIRLKTHLGINLFLVDEPLLHTDNNFQKLTPQILKILSDELDLQFIIATHSMAIINSALRIGGQKVYHIENSSCLEEEGVTAIEINSYNKMLSDVGTKPSDLLFSNGIIWVEGPSDAIYLKYWLSQVGLEEDIHYNFAFYGGKILKHHTATTDENVDTLVKMARNNTRNIVYMDSDKGNSNSPLSDTKQRVIGEIQELHDSGIWISDGREIENYLSKQMLESYLRAEGKNIDEEPYQKHLSEFGKFQYIWKIETGKDSDNKPIFKELIKMNLANWVIEQGYKLKDFELELKKKITELAGTIKNWN